MQLSTRRGAVAAAVAAAGIAAGVWFHQRDVPIVFRIPPGTVAAAAAGVPENVIPDDVYVDLRKTDTVIIANDDGQAFLFGSASVLPGQELVQRFEVPGVYMMMCSLRGNQIRFVVLGPDGTTTNPEP